MSTQSKKEDSTVLKFNNLQYTKSFHATILVFSAFVLLIIIAIFLVELIKDSALSVIAGTIISAVYFTVLNKKMVLKTADFNLLSDKIEWDGRSINFKEIEYYKIHNGLQGASFKFKLKNGQKIHLMSTKLFCNNVVEFMALCIRLDGLLKQYDESLKTKTFSEARFYPPLLISLVLFATSLTLYIRFRGSLVLYEVLFMFVVAIAVFISLWKSYKK